MKKFKTEIIFLCLLLIYGVLISYTDMPTIPCVFRLVTGFLCPGCGGNGAVIELMNFNFYQSFRYNMLLYFVTPLIFTSYYFYYKNNLKLYKMILNLSLILTIIFGVLRNTDLFSWMAPVIV